MFKVIRWMLVSRSRLLTELLDSRWPQEFLVKLTLTEPEKVSEHLLMEQTLVVVDLATVDLQKAYQLQRQIERLPSSIRTVFIQYPRKVDARFLINPSVSAGVFYIDDSLEFISNGLGDILNGRYHIPGELLKSSGDDESDDDTDSLTIREREVLQALLSGSTNQDIARQLFVSESTIKTHLYRAFRKIGVSSRGQAIAWAQTHLHEVQV
ncbi:MAG: LuxR C-terminal-related transcriptional regulator [Shewanella sp.]|nr:LuxR C-terminal-related transcriptional regulator [Shewanella sp.]MCF1432131.1 LuxR C-terminal-related transcriptional regulator [Shewanella sp.]MCF1439956.1 LuxR C-terminal-related transcriptional regulator [Shewanella sp.]MCF1456461.1 LuxR C-terminal-related transcriptional regulator [Shewanella sp.]MCF1459339.1 LuxR C-terminal-related transcriptional regulator [Shewanella sp.]